jgi:hypothetical protein
MSTSRSRNSCGDVGFERAYLIEHPGELGRPFVLRVNYVRRGAAKQS